MLVEFNLQYADETRHHHVVSDQKNDRCEVTVRQHLTHCSEGLIRHLGAGNACVHKGENRSKLWIANGVSAGFNRCDLFVGPANLAGLAKMLHALIGTPLQSRDAQDNRFTQLGLQAGCPKCISEIGQSARKPSSVSNNPRVRLEGNLSYWACCSAVISATETKGTRDIKSPVNGHRRRYGHQADVQR